MRRVRSEEQNVGERLQTQAPLERPASGGCGLLSVALRRRGDYIFKKKFIQKRHCIAGMLM